jgi:hypothetical protein
MGKVWRCSWCGKAQPHETFGTAVRGEHEPHALTYPYGRLPVHACCEEHYARTLDYLRLCDRWFCLTIAGSLLLLAAVAISGLLRPPAMGGMGLLALGVLLFCLPVGRALVKLPPEVTRWYLRWKADLLMPNGTPGDVLFGWRAYIWFMRSVAVLTFVAGVLVVSGLLSL